MQLVLGQQPNIFHLRMFGCAVYVPIAPPQLTKMGPKHRLGVYMGFDSLSIIRYLEPLTGDFFKAYYFNKTIEKSRCLNYDVRLLGMFRRYLILTLIQINVNWKFKGLFICKELQINYWMYSPTIRK